MRAVIITGGNIEDYAYTKTLILPNDYIICADSGFDHALKMQIKPHILLGDLDSIKSKPSPVQTIIYPTEKDMTDTELAVAYAKEKGYTQILLLGAIGTRMDHSIANILLLVAYIDDRTTITIADEYNKINLLKKETVFYGQPGDLISLVPLSTCKGVTTTNLKYPLKDAIIQCGSSIGISNVFVKHSAKVSIKSGWMLGIQSRD